MTREEAISWLNDMKNLEPNWAQEVAIDMAIEALKADVARWSSWNKTFEQSGIADLISRADAIEAVYKLLWNEPPYCDSEALCRERAKEIVNAHAGEININSEVNVGTEIIITLPVDKSLSEE